jgi:predicted membrane protein
MNLQKVVAWLVLLLGLLLLANNFLGLQISFFKAMLGLGLVLLGVAAVRGRLVPMFTGSIQRGNNVLFGSGRVEVADEPNKERFSTIFGEQRISFEKLSAGGKEVVIDTVFGETKVYVPRNLPIRVQANSVFGEAKMPDGAEVNFGERNFEALQGLSSAALHIKASVVFGSIKVKWV